MEDIKYEAPPGLLGDEDPVELEKQALNITYSPLLHGVETYLLAGASKPSDEPIANHTLH